MRVYRDIEAEIGRRDREELLRKEAERERTIIHTRVVQESIRCSRPNCHCASGGEHRHGPYWYAVDTYANGARKKRYIGKKKPPGA